MANPNTIVLKGDLGRRYEEYRVGTGPITPGHLVETNNVGKVVKHGTSGGSNTRAFAIEDALQGRTIDDTYATDELCRVHHADPGEEIYAVLKQGQNVNESHYLMSNGDGTLVVVGGGGTPVGKCAEAIDLTAAGADGRVKIRVI